MLAQGRQQLLGRVVAGLKQAERCRCRELGLGAFDIYPLLQAPFIQRAAQHDDVLRGEEELAVADIARPLFRSLQYVKFSLSQIIFA